MAVLHLDMDVVHRQSQDLGHHLGKDSIAPLPQLGTAVDKVYRAVLGYLDDGRRGEVTAHPVAGLLGAAGETDAAVGRFPGRFFLPADAVRHLPDGFLQSRGVYSGPADQRLALFDDIF